MASVGDKSSPTKEKRNSVLCFCASSEVSAVNINDDQVQLFPTYTFYFLLQYGCCMDFSLHLHLNLLN